MSFKIVEDFEKLLGEFYGSPFAVATDSCTHAIELCLRTQIEDNKKLIVPKRTYISIPFLAHKLNMNLFWQDNNWKDYYYLEGTNIIDAAVFWKENGYIKNSLMCLSFQFQKHLNIGRGGLILLDDHVLYEKLSKMVYDGRIRNVAWRDQDIKEIGYHYYMTPENAEIGINKFNTAKNRVPRKWSYLDYPDLSKMSVFKKYNF